MQSREAATQMSYTRQLVHVVFGVKGRTMSLSKGIQGKLFPYMIGIARNLDSTVLAIDGVEDHLHLLADVRLIGQSREQRLEGLLRIDGNATRRLVASRNELQTRRADHRRQRAYTKREPSPPVRRSPHPNRPIRSQSRC